MGIAGVFIGATLWTLSARIDWPALWQGVLAAMTTGAAAMLMLSPFEFTDAYHGAGPFSLATFGGATPPERVGHLN